MSNKSTKEMVLQVFRKPSTYFYSIENVFSAIRPFFEKYDCEVVHASKYGLSFSNILQLRKWKKRADIFHVTGDIHYAVFAFPKRRVILTIHDCVFLNSYSGLKRNILKKVLLQWPVQYAGMITTISEKSKTEIIENTGCHPDKVMVIPNPVKPVFHYLPKDFNKSKPRILFLGKTPNKNLDRVIESLQGIPCLLNIVGKPSQRQLELLEEKGIHHLVESSLSEVEVAERYKMADMILFPSYYEGFGLPILEAFKSGRVIITSNISPMKELADGAAYLVDPYDVANIKSVIQRAISNDGERSELVSRGFEVVKQYEAVIISELYEKAYSLLMSNKRN